MSSIDNRLRYNSSSSSAASFSKRLSARAIRGDDIRAAILLSPATSSSSIDDWKDSNNKLPYEIRHNISFHYHHCYCYYYYYCCFFFFFFFFFFRLTGICRLELSCPPASKRQAVKSLPSKFFAAATEKEKEKTNTLQTHNNNNKKKKKKTNNVTQESRHSFLCVLSLSQNTTT
jgi:hypothetical protein